MRFLLSDFRPEGPCFVEGAYRGTYTWIDRRTPASNLGLSGFYAEMWFARGTNHRTEGDSIVRDLGEIEGWFLDVPDLDALDALREEHGDLLIGSNDHGQRTLGRPFDLCW